MLIDLSLLLLTAAIITRNIVTSIELTILAPKLLVHVW